MEARRKGWNIILIGSWNISIFSPDWVSENLFGKAEVQVEFPLTPGLSPRYTYKGVIVHLEGERLIVQPQETNDVCVSAAEQVAVNILSKLPHTPVGAVGVNFLYRDSNPSPWVQNMFDFADSDYIADAGYRSEFRQIRRSLKRDKRALNLTITLSANGSVTFDFNYHAQVSNADAASKAIDGQVVELARDARQLLDGIYAKDMAEVTT